MSKVVPIEPTFEQWQAGSLCLKCHDDTPHMESPVRKAVAIAVYKHMVAAVPDVPAPAALLCNGARFQLNFSGRGKLDCFASYAAQLTGRWVALVDATDDIHLRPEAPVRALTEAEIKAIGEKWGKVHPVDLSFQVAGAVREALALERGK